MDKVRAKFRCVSVGLVFSHAELEDGKWCTPGTPGSVNKLSTTFKFMPVYSDKEGSENKRYWDATPGGGLELNVTKLPHDAFQPNKEYYLDITPAD
jgi:hypothetical protein